MPKILIIEDNEDIAEILRDSLVADGFEAIVCHDAYQGVEFTHKMNPDLVLLDLMIPAGGGLSVLQKIRLSSYTKSIPVVVLTASKESEHKEKAKELGVQAYLEKPYDSKVLLATIRGVLGQ